MNAITITLKGGLRDGERCDVPFMTPTVEAPGAYEHSIRVWREDHFVNLFPTEVYAYSHDSVYLYSHTEPPA